MQVVIFSTWLCNFSFPNKFSELLVQPLVQPFPFKNKIVPAFISKLEG